MNALIVKGFTSSSNDKCCKSKRLCLIFFVRHFICISYLSYGKKVHALKLHGPEPTFSSLYSITCFLNYYRKQKTISFLFFFLFFVCNTNTTYFRRRYDTTFQTCLCLKLYQTFCWSFYVFKDTVGLTTNILDIFEILRIQSVDLPKYELYSLHVILYWFNQ